MSKEGRPIRWLGSTLEDLRGFPEAVRRGVGHSLREAQDGLKARNAKPVEGFKGATVLKIVEDHDGETYRAVYTVKFEEAVYVLHCFQKKSKSGIATPKQDIESIRQRYKLAEAEHKKWEEQQKK